MKHGDPIDVWDGKRWRRGTIDSLPGNPEEIGHGWIGVAGVSNAGSISVRAGNCRAVLRCASCRGTAHPATGCQYSESHIVCGPCTRNFWTWVKGHTDQMRRVGPRGSKEFVSFYEHAGNHVQEPLQDAFPAPKPATHAVR